MTERAHYAAGRIVSASDHAKRWPQPPVGTVETMHSIDVDGDRHFVSRRAFDALKQIAQRHGNRSPHVFLARLFKAEGDRERAGQYVHDSIGAVLRGEPFAEFNFTRAGD